MILAGTCVLATQHLVHACEHFVRDQWSAETDTETADSQVEVKREGITQRDKLWMLCHVSAGALALWGRELSVSCFCGSVLSIATDVKNLWEMLDWLKQGAERHNSGNLESQKIRHILVRALSALLAFGVFSAAPQIVAGALVGKALLIVYNEYDEAKRHDEVTYAEVWSMLAIQLTLMAGAWYASPLLIAAAAVAALVRQRELFYLTATYIKQACHFN